MAKLISKDTYLEKVGSRINILFEFNEYKILDNMIEDLEDMSCFLIQYDDEDDTYYELTIREVYDLLVLSRLGVDNDIILERIEELVYEVEEEVKR